MAAVVIAPTARCAPRPTPAASPAVPETHPGWRPPPVRSVPSPAAGRLDRSVYRRRRVVVLVLGLLVLVGLVGVVVRAAQSVSSWRTTTNIEPELGGVSGSSAPLVAPVSASERSSPQVYVVEPGDTLWSIARRFDPGGDPRPIVDRLAEQSGGSALRPGQRLSLDGLP